MKTARAARAASECLLGVRVTETTEANRESGWTPDWQLFETPESRRLDLRVKSVSVIELVLLLAFCSQLLTALVNQLRWPWSGATVVGSLCITFITGPPRHHPLTGLARVALAAVIGPSLMVATSLLLLLAETADHFLMPRLFAAGEGGKLPSARATRHARVAGLQNSRRARAERWRTRVSPYLS
jgi:hypothetical protein